MSVLAYLHDAFGQHDTGLGHVEQMARYTHIKQAVYKSGWKIITAPLCDEAWLELAHSSEYLASIDRANARIQAGETRFCFDADTSMMCFSREAALRAVGANIAGVDALLAGKAKRAYVGARPPGHHAERNRAMGFCLYSSVALAAKYAVEKAGLERVALLDFDVHHGNGTQDVVQDDPRILFISSHQMPLYPGSGYAHEEGCGNVLNMPLKPGDDSKDFKEAWSLKAFPRIKAFSPQLILVSAGFDAHKDDPLSTMNLQVEDFAWIGQEIRKLAEDCCDGRVLSSQEGGYNLEALEASLYAYLIGLK